MASSSLSLTELPYCTNLLKTKNMKQSDQRLGHLYGLSAMSFDDLVKETQCLKDSVEAAINIVASYSRDQERHLTKKALKYMGVDLEKFEIVRNLIKEGVIK